jgi:hypothetical protein
MTTISATYSPEDNKLRLYASSRLDAETYARVKAAGFIWAPKQELFVAPKWSTKREDLCIELAGEIEPEEMTLAERAQMKAERLDNLAERKTRQASAFQKAAQDISERFYMGQPILVGHHSERKARKDKERMDGAQRKAIESQEAAGYWLYKAEGVERHANYKNDPRTRARRIETLLSELREIQRGLNENYRALKVWEAATSDQAIRHIIGHTGIAPYGLWGELEAGTITPQEARERCIAAARRGVESPRAARWIAHTLNRLAYERELLGPVSRYMGEITPTLLQIFVRTHGADKPQGKKLDDGFFSVQCDAPLPAHIGLGDYVELHADEWRDLMQSCGYEVPAKKDAKPPILNFKAPSGSICVVNPWRREAENMPQAEMTAAQYGAIHSDQRGTRLSSCGGFRVRIAPNPNATGPVYSRGWAAIHITDQKAHPVPGSVLEFVE